MEKLSLENYQKGFLVDDLFLAGVAEDDAGGFSAYVLNHQTGEYQFHQILPSAQDAIQVLNQIDRAWSFESTSACGSGKCGEGAQCGTGLCPKVSSCATC